MAKVVNTVPDKASGRKEVYAKFFDGQLWELGLEDAHGTKKLSTMRSCVVSAAARHGVKVMTAVRGDKLYVQAQVGKAAE